MAVSISVTVDMEAILRMFGHRASVRRMAAGMHLDQPVDRYLGVDGRRFEALVPKELLDVADVGPALQHVGRTRVPQQVAGAAPEPRRASRRTAWETTSGLNASP